MSRTRKYSLLFGSKAKYSGFGLKGCSHGMYSPGGYNFWVYGVKGMIAFEIYEGWGLYRNKK